MTFLMVPFLYFLDRFTKKWALEELSLNKSQYYVKGKVSTRLVFNKGAALGFLKDKPLWLHGLTLLSIIILMVLGVPFWFMRKGRLGGLAYAMILAGALGNYRDRLKDGQVTDFISFGPKHDLHYNVADFAIFLGAILLVVKEMIYE